VTKKAVTLASSLTLCRYAAIEVPTSFIKASEENYVKRLERVPEVKQYDQTSIKKSVDQMKQSSFEKYLKNLSQCVTTRASSDEGQFGQYSTINEYGPHISFSNVRGQTYNGVCPSPYFGYNLVGSELTGNVTHLTEPLKVRSITTSNAFEFFAGKPFQATISSEMKKMENLCYGRTVEEEDVYNLIYRSKKYYGEEEELIFLSGDYEAATDNINPYLSALVDEHMLKHLNLNFSLPDLTPFESLKIWKVMACIYNYLLSDVEADLGPNTSEMYWSSINLIFMKFLPRKGCTVLHKRREMWSGRIIRNKDTNLEFTQTFGQMMGDIKSFPVLCLINLSLWNLVNKGESVISKEEKICPLTGDKTLVFDKISPPCLINGDDFLAYCPRRVIDEWFSKVQEFDLVASIGKTHESKEIAQINSINFSYNKNTGVVKKVKAIPLHAVLKIPHNRPVEQTINYAIEHDESLLNRVLFFNKNRINEVTQNGLINLCVPRELGGIGVKATLKKVTAKQSIIASVNLRRMKSGRDPIALQYDWLPFLAKKKRSGFGTVDHKTQFFVYTKKPKGSGVVKDQYDITHLLPTYSASRESRLYCKDDPIGVMSRQDYGTRGIMRIRNNFYGKFQKVSNQVIRDSQQRGDFRDKILQPEDFVVPPVMVVKTKKGHVLFNKEHEYIQSTSDFVQVSVQEKTDEVPHAFSFFQRETQRNGFFLSVNFRDL